MATVWHTVRQQVLAGLVVFVGATIIQAAGPSPVPKIVLIAGPLDRSHPPGTHEYEKTVRLIKHCLDSSPDRLGVRIEVHLGGWPADPRTLEDASTIVLVSSGSDRQLADHPLLVGDRLAVIERQMKRGCGLALMHWAVFVPNKEAGDRVLDWVGGHFDYQSGPPPRGWYSRIQTTSATVRPGPHAITRGIEPFELRDEFYYHLRFRERDPRLAPVATITLPKEKEGQVVGWAVERRDGGRGFGFTGSHFFDNWRNDSFRRLMLQAILWTAKVDFPRAGLRTTFPPEDALAGKEPAGKTITLVEGKFGKALNAAASPIAVPGSDTYRQPPLTVECWARLNSRAGFNVLVASDPKTSSRHWEVYTYARTGAFAAYLPGYEPAEIVSTTNAADGRWHYLAMSFDGKQVRLYVDGRSVKEQTVRPRPDGKPVAGPLTIGEAIDAGGRIGCDGVIDEVRISRGVRTIDRVPEGELPHDPLTIAQWRFNEVEGLTADPAWTPPPALEGPAWQRQTDADWVDARLRSMDTGPTFNATFRYPSWAGSVLAYKGTAIRLGDDGSAAVLFDRNQLRLAAGWTGGYLQHSDMRFGLINTPKPAGPLTFTTSSQPGWDDPEGRGGSFAATAPLPKTWGRFEGLNLHGKRVVLSYTIGGVSVRESPWIEKEGGLTTFTRTVEVGPSEKPLRLLVCELPAPGALVRLAPDVTVLGAQKEGTWVVVGTSKGGDAVSLDLDGKTRAKVLVPPGREVRRFKLLIGQVSAARELAAFHVQVKKSPPPENLAILRKPGPARWTASIVTHGERGSGPGPYVIDTLTVPYSNPHRALMFLSGLDFLPDGTLAVCSAHGDVWLVKGVGERLEKLTWKRFATGLYQPLGLKVVDGKICVLERGQLTRLHDLDGDGEADLYENVCNDWHTGNGEHSYDTCLETDPAGNFYFFKTGDPQLPSGGCLLRVPPDGSKAEVFATGFRHPIGLSASADGLITGADQQGNWMPATRIDIYHQGGFYGDLRAHHRSVAPASYDPPLLWLPHDIDNSAGGQVWVSGDRFGLPAGQLLHLSYGQCKLFLVMRQEVKGVAQGGAVDLGLFFLSGVMRGRFNPRDGQLYVCGLRGWQNAARADGCLQRVRYTGGPIDQPATLAVEAGGIRVGFRTAVDKTLAWDRSRYQIEQWGYRWTGEYGSKDYSVADPSREGHDPVPIEEVRVAEDGRSVFLAVRGLRPVMQMRIRYDLKTEGRPLRGEIFNTINQVPERGK
jgi:hypothetical protein